MRCARPAPILATILVVACAGNPDRHTLAELHRVEPDMTEVQVDDSLDRAMIGYRQFLEEAPASALTPEAMRRLADLELEKEYGILGGNGAKVRELPAPEPSAATADGDAGSPRPRVPGIADHSESEVDFERRATGESAIEPSHEESALALPAGEEAASAGPLEAIALYDRILADYPTYVHNDQVLYQKARAYDELGRPDEAIAVIERLIAEYPHSRHIDEVQFRRAEYSFTRKKYLDAEEAYSAITGMGEGSEYYELALYKLGWTFYKQELHEEALDQYFALLDYKVSNGYDFDQKQDEGAERRIADTFRVISLSFSSLGGPEVVEAYFVAHGGRSYEDRIYSHLGEFYLEKLRYHDAAASYRAFVDLHPLHRASPRFGMRVVEIYEAGGFPKLVLESKKEFAAAYGLQSEYWRHFDIDAAPDVRSYLKDNLEDLANHYHALYQESDLADARPENFQEALRWYRAYLTSFPRDLETPSVNHRLGDLLLEHRDFGAAAREYERTAYDYPEYAQAAAAGYAAIFAHRENQKLATDAERAAVRREAVASTLRFVDTFPDHEQAAAVLGAAVDDLYEMKEFERAIATGRRLIDEHPGAEVSIRRSAWTVIAHASFDTADYANAEQAYARVLELTPADGDSRQAVVDNFAAAIYKQGEQAKLAEDYRAAADHFLRISEAAPTSDIRPAAEYDAGAALIRLEDWAAAVAVLESFRQAYPAHDLYREATKQIAFIRREQGDLAGAAAEYERVAEEAEDAELRREALLVAGELYEDASAADPALAVYLRYLGEFPEPLETAVETRFKVAELYESTNDEASYHEQLEQIVAIDRAAAEERTPRIRHLAALSALVLSEGFYHRFAEIELTQPFERNLHEKQRRMSAALEAFGALVDYEVGEVTAAATFYMAEVYFDFSQALIESERPADLDPAEMQDYEMVLEEEAFPFEEKAIEVHEKNLELMASGTYNRWIEKSLAKLGELMPGRYAKFEVSSGWIDSIDTYAYRMPRAPEASAGEAAAGEGGGAAPAAADEPALAEEVPAAPAALADALGPAEEAQTVRPAAEEAPEADAAPAPPVAGATASPAPASPPDAGSAGGNDGEGAGADAVAEGGSHAVAR
jgi:tetratricopeptide (TPR) repeat protein